MPPKKGAKPPMKPVTKPPTKPTTKPVKKPVAPPTSTPSNLLPLATADPEDDEDDEEAETSIWEMKEEVLTTAPKAGSSKSSKTAATTQNKTTTQIFWKIKNDAKIPEPKSNLPAYVPWIGEDDVPGSSSSSGRPSGSRKRPNDSVATKPVKFMLVSQWDSLRRLPTVEPYRKNLSGRAAVGLRARTIGGVILPNGENSAPLVIPAKNQGASKTFNWISFFDEHFVQCENDSVAIQNSIKDGEATFARWTPIPYTYKVASGVFELDKNGQPSVDKRTFTEVEGIAFTYSGSGTAGADNVLGLTDDYVRLRKSIEGNMVKMFDTAGGTRQENLEADRIHLKRSTLDALRTGAYNWTANKYDVCFRNGDGTPTFFSCADWRLQTQSFWEKAYQHGISAEQSYGTRSRNVSNIELRLVVPTGSTRTTDVSLRKTMQNAKDASSKTIDTKAVVLSQKDFEAKDKATYNHLLSVSPFGDFETWVKEDDHVSYLKSYPGYTPPDVTNIAVLKKVMDTLVPKKANSDKTAKWDATRAEQAKKLSPSGTIWSDTTYSNVSFTTINDASKKDPRGSIPEYNQGRQMGGSATAVATALNWPGASAGTRVPGVIDTSRTPNVVWDSPGVYQAEWLHRTAYSWGSAGSGHSSRTNQSASNFIFGSSEANSLMTRYEKAWQSIFYKESRYEGELAKANLKDDSATVLTAVLTTINTNVDIPIVDYKVGPANAAKLKTVTITKGLNKTTVTSSDPNFKPADYWQVSKDDTNLCFSLAYSLTLKKISALGISCLPWIEFYPFQRGFFTRLEGAIDAQLLQEWTDDAIAKISLKTAMTTTTTTTTTTPVKQVADASVAMTNLSLTPIGALLASSNGAVKARALDVSAQAPHAQVWKDVHAGKPLTVGGVDLQNPGLVTADKSGRAIVSAIGNGAPIPPGRPQGPAATVATAPTPPKAAAVAPNSTALASKVPVSSSPHPHKEVSEGKSATAPHHSVASVPSTTVEAVGSPKTPATPAATASPLAGKNFVAPTPSGDPPKRAPIVVPVNNDPADNNNVPNGFVLSGNVKLFGLFDEQMYSYHGDAAVGDKQIVQIRPGTVKISQYLPVLAGSGFDAIQLQNIQFVYNSLTTATDSAGTWLQADVLFAGPLQPVSDFFKNVCHQDKPMLRMQALMSLQNDWSRPITLRELALRCVLPNVSIKVGDLLTITELGVGVSLAQSRQTWPPYNQAWNKGISFFGSLNLETPKQMAPMMASFSIAYIADTLNLSLDVYQDDTSTVGFCGIEGLKLDQLSMSTTLSTSKSPSLLGFDISAKLSLSDAVVGLEGYYSKSDWGLRGAIYDFDFDNVRDMYEDLFGAELHITDHDIDIDEIDFYAGSTGMSLSAQITIEGYTALQAEVSISRLGLEISGEVDDIILDGDIVLKKAAFDVFIGRQSDTTVSGPGTSFRFAITGVVDIGNTEVSASLFLDKGADGKLLWTVIGSFTGDFSLSKIEPALKNTFLDLSVTEVALIASNVDGVAAAGATISPAYTIVKGVQIAAVLGPIGAIDGALDRKNTPTTGLTLSATYDATNKSFELAIRLSVPQTMAMHSGTVYSGPISLLIMASPTPAIAITANFFVRVPNQDPLKFTGGLSLSLDEAKLFIELKNQWWNNPFGLSEKLRLGPDLALQIGIVYAGPIYPSEVGVAAGLAFGAVSGKAALSISEAPNDELIMMEVDNLGITDVVDFANTLLDVSIPEPDDFLRFKQVEFYLSTGTTIGTIVYPPGASFSCDAVVFGIEATCFVGVDKSAGQIRISGSLDPIDIGPLSVSGFDPDTNAQLDVQIGPVLQSLLLDGGIRILDKTVKIKVTAVLIPSPAFDLYFELDFTSHLAFTLEAHMNGTLAAGAATGSLEFYIHAVFQQDILDYIVAQVNTQILAAKHAVDDGIDAAKSTLSNAENAYKVAVDAAAAKLDEAAQAFNGKLAEANAALEAEQNRAATRTQELAAEVSNAASILNAAIDQAKLALQKVNEDANTAITNAQGQVDQAKIDSDAAIDGHLRDLANARTDMQSQFGDALNNIQNAKNNLAGARRDRDNAQTDYDNAKRDYDNASGWGWFSASANLTAASFTLGERETAYRTAEGALDVANAVVAGPGYQAAQGTINGYQAQVDAAKQAADGTMAAANGTLEATKVAQAQLVQAAQDALTLVQNSGVERQAADIASGALIAFNDAEYWVLQGLQDAVDAVGSSVEAAAYNSALFALQFAQANANDIQLAQGALDLAEQGTDGVLDAGNWIVAHAANILNIQSVDVTGDLRGLTQGFALHAHIVGTFAEHPVDVTVDFVPGQGEQVAKQLFDMFMSDVKNGMLNIAG